ncbi:sensor histidine kinase [Blastococcus sp. SYSU D00813]
MGSAPGARLVRPPSDAADPGWTSLVEGRTTARGGSGDPTARHVVGRFVLANLLAVALLVAGAVWAGRQAATAEAIADARRATDLLATLLVVPNLQEGLLDDDPAAVAALDEAIDVDRLASADVRHVKIWAPDDRIVYSDDPGLIGGEFELSSDHRRTLQDGVTRAERTDFSRPENRFDRSAGETLEIYRRIHTPGGQALLLETHATYSAATARQSDIWLRFAPITLTVLLALLAVQVPLVRRMVARLRAEQREREALQARALDASGEERRRIAGSLHDGIVQDVSAAALLVAGAADQVRATSGRCSPADVAGVLAEAAAALRGSARSLRSLLVEIHPPNLERAGLASALEDLAARLRLRGTDVRVLVPDDLRLPLEAATVLFRTAQEALQNVARHAGASVVEITLTRSAGSAVLEVRDDGVGFDLAATLAGPRGAHLGLSTLTDLAGAAGARLDVRTAPGAGTHLRMEVPLP